MHAIYIFAVSHVSHSQPTLMSEPRLFVSCNHRLATDISVWRKSTKAFSETQMVIWNYNRALYIICNCVWCIFCTTTIYNAYVGISCIQGFVSRKLVVINRYLPAGQFTQPWAESLVLWERGSQRRRHSSIRGLAGAERKMTMSVQQQDTGRLDDLRAQRPWSSDKAVIDILYFHSYTVSQSVEN